MFVQVIEAPVADPAAARAHFQTWIDDVSPGAIGWLGSTAGVTPDGTLVAVARFESEDAARRNSERPEQDAWWQGMAALLSGEATFRDSTRVLEDLHGDPDQAGFVQVMQGGSTDPDRAWKLMEADDTDWSAFRPDILGSLNIGHDGGRWTMVNWFTTEAEAREGEKKDVPPELRAQMDELGSLAEGEMRFLDISDPWMWSPR